MKYTIFLLLIFLIAPGCSRKESPAPRQKTKTEESIAKTIAQINKINDTLSIFTQQIASASDEELKSPVFQDNLQTKLDGFSKHLNSCKSEIKSLAAIDKDCRAEISKLQDVISKGEEKISLLQKDIAEIKTKSEKKESQMARAL